MVRCGPCGGIIPHARSPFGQEVDEVVCPYQPEQRVAIRWYEDFRQEPVVERIMARLGFARAVS